MGWMPSIAIKIRNVKMSQWMEWAILFSDKPMCGLIQSLFAQWTSRNLGMWETTTVENIRIWSIGEIARIHDIMRGNYGKELHMGHLQRRLLNLGDVDHLTVQHGFWPTTQLVLNINPDWCRWTIHKLASSHVREREKGFTLESLFTSICNEELRATLLTQFRTCLP